MSKHEINYVSGYLNLGHKPINFEESTKVISHSQISKYRKCPNQWKLEYIDGHKSFDENIHVVYGTAMHEVIQTWLKVMYTISGKEANKMDLKQMLLENLKSEYKKRLQNNNGVHFSSKEEMITYWGYGCAVLEFLKKKRSDYFKLRGWELAGIELPIWYEVEPKKRPGVHLMAYLDVVLYDKKYDEYLIMDLKTSKKGWKSWDKKDRLKTDQLVLYKKYFCEQYNVEPKKVDVQFFILKSTINEDSMWPEKRVQTFTPSNGSVSINRTVKEVDQFLMDAFKSDGTYNPEKEYLAVSGKNGWNCTFCQFKDDQEKCPKEKRLEELPDV